MDILAAYGSSGKLEIELENADGKSVGLGRRGNLIIGHVTMSWSRKSKIISIYIYTSLIKEDCCLDMFGEVKRLVCEI